MMMNCAQLFLNPTMHDKICAGHKHVSLKPMHKVSVRTVTLTFDLATWFLFVQHRFLITLTMQVESGLNFRQCLIETNINISKELHFSYVNFARGPM